MKALAVILVSAFLAVGKTARAEDPVLQVRVTLRVIEVPHAQVTKWTGGAPMKGWQLHDEAVKLALAGGAEIVETNVLTVRSGEKAQVESIAEMMSPTVYEPPGSTVPLGATSPATVYYYRPYNVFNAFETRSAGVVLEVWPTISARGRLVDLGVSFETAQRVGLATITEFRDRWGDGSVRTPLFESKRLSSTITLAAGKFELWNIFTPKPAAVPAVTTRMMVFVRADVVPVVENP